MNIWDIAVYLFWSLLAMGLLLLAIIIIIAYVLGEVEKEMIEGVEREVGPWERVNI